MKKIISLLLVLAVMLCIVSCSFLNTENNEGKTAIRIGYLTGPTGMGMAKLIHDNGGMETGNEKYTFTKYADSGAAKADLAAGKIDVICLPTNEAATYYTASNQNSKVLAINCLNSLYLLSLGDNRVNSLSDLEGQTVYTCKNGTPRLVLEHIVSELKLEINICYEIDGKEIVTPQDLSTCVITGAIPNAVMPEPLVTSSLLAISKNGNGAISYTVDVNLADEWSKISDTPVAMGCIVADSEFVMNHADLIESFLQEYKASIEYIGDPNNVDSAAEYVVESGIMGALPAAKKAIANLSGAIAYIDGIHMKNTLTAFYSALNIPSPDDNFYYEK